MKTYFTILLLLICSLGFSQIGPANWDTTSIGPSSFRYDDVFFLNQDTGWAVSNNGKQIIRTYNGGTSWDTLSYNVYSVRNIAFLDARVGFVGLIVPFDTNKCLLKTTDGGETWDTVDLPGPSHARGICGMYVVNDSTICAVGRYWGPAGFYKTTDRGSSWTYRDMSPYAFGLIDVFFFNPDTGYASGTLYNDMLQTPNPDSSAIILYTTDGGNTWQTVAKTGRKKELCWKISFPSRNVGYTSIQSVNSNSPPLHFFKTTDGGLTWQEKTIFEPGMSGQGIGFINDTVGWIGTHTSYSYQTTDGGNNWIICPNITVVNRFRFLPNKIGYAGGKYIYKLDFSSCQAATFVQVDTSIESGSSLILPSGNVVNSAGVYTDTISGPVGCERIIETTVSVISSISDEIVSKQYIRIHPNPAKNQLNVEWNDAGLAFKGAQLISINGQILTISISQSAQRLTLNWSDETPKGVYTLKLKSTEGKEVTRKVVIL